MNVAPPHLQPLLYWQTCSPAEFNKPFGVIEIKVEIKNNNMTHKADLLAWLRTKKILPQGREAWQLQTPHVKLSVVQWLPLIGVTHMSSHNLDLHVYVYNSSGYYYNYYYDYDYYYKYTEFIEILGTLHTIFSALCGAPERLLPQWA